MGTVTKRLLSAVTGMRIFHDIFIFVGRKTIMLWKIPHVNILKWAPLNLALLIEHTLYTIGLVNRMTWWPPLKVQRLSMDLLLDINVDIVIDPIMAMK